MGSRRRRSSCRPSPRYLRGDTSIEDRVRFDNRYIDQYSLFLDLVIAVKTVGSLFRSKHSY